MAKHSDDNPYMSLDEAIEYIMRARGKTRRQAKAMLYEAARQGKIPARGIPEDDPDGGHIPIPPEAWPKVN